MLHIVLYSPDIPQNTGNIMRTCAALNAKLHLIEPLGFVLDEKRVKRAVMDYIDILDYTVHKNYEDFSNSADGKFYFLSRFGKKTHSDFDYKSVDKDIYLIFGSETKGLPETLIKNNMESTFRIPMSPHARSLNLSNAVAIASYEVQRQLDYCTLAKEDLMDGKDVYEEK